jgi:hypothetical protein
VDRCFQFNVERAVHPRGEGHSLLRQLPIQPKPPNCNDDL